MFPISANASHPQALMSYLHTNIKDKEEQAADLLPDPCRLASWELQITSNCKLRIKSLAGENILYRKCQR
jgi:hypothetical protein